VREDGLYSLREYLEKQYAAPIILSRYREHHIDNFNRVYLVSTQLNDGKYYIVRSKWKKIFPYGYPIWAVEQDTYLVEDKEFNKKIRKLSNEIIMKYGHSDFRNNKKFYVKYFENYKKLNSMKFNILNGVILKRFVNPDYISNNDNKIKNKYSDFEVNLHMIWNNIYGNFGYNEIIIKGFKHSQICKIENKFKGYYSKSNYSKNKSFIIKNNSIIFYIPYIGVSDHPIKEKRRLLREVVKRLKNMNDVYKFFNKIIL